MVGSEVDVLSSAGTLEFVAIMSAAEFGMKAGCQDALEDCEAIAQMGVEEPKNSILQGVSKLVFPSFEDNTRYPSICKIGCRIDSLIQRHPLKDNSN